MVSQWNENRTDIGFGFRLVTHTFGTSMHTKLHVNILRHGHFATEAIATKHVSHLPFLINYTTLGDQMQLAFIAQTAHYARGSARHIDKNI